MTLDANVTLKTTDTEPSPFYMLEAIYKALCVDKNASVNIVGADTTNPLPCSLVGSLANQVILQSNATIIQNGNIYTPTTDVTLTFTITGSSTARTTVFEIADPVKGVWQNLVLATKLGDTTYTPQLRTTGGSDTLPETWQVDIPANFSFRVRQSIIPVGGNVNISGYAKVVIS